MKFRNAVYSPKPVFTAVYLTMAVGKLLTIKELIWSIYYSLISEGWFKYNSLISEGWSMYKSLISEGWSIHYSLISEG